MTVRQQLSTRAVAPDPEVIAEFLNRELVPVVRLLRDDNNDFETRIATLETPPFEADFGDGVAVTFDFAHGFDTYAVVATIWDNATRQRQPLATESTPDTNTYRVTVGAPPTASQYHIAIARMRG